MANLSLTEKQAKEIYPNASAEIKMILESSFDKKVFLIKITDRIKSFEDACGVLNINPFDILNPEDTRDEAAYKQLKIITKALNQGWTPDWDNSNEYKWYLWFYMNRPGFRLHAAAYCYTSSDCRLPPLLQI
jgi:hypothetical protein